MIIILAVFLFLDLDFFLGWISVIWQVEEEIIEKLKRKRTWRIAPSIPQKERKL